MADYEKQVLIAALDSKLGTGNRRKRIVDLSLNYNNYFAFTRFLGKAGGEKHYEERNGNSITNILATELGGGGGGWVGFNEKDSFVFKNKLKSGSIPWRWYKETWALDERDIAQASGPEQVIDMMWFEIEQTMKKIGEDFETAWITSPTDSSDEETPMGLKFWLQEGASTGFTGLDPSGFAAGRAGISSTDFPKWANYYATFSTYTLGSFSRVFKKAMDLTQWREPSDSNTELGTDSFNEWITSLTGGYEADDYIYKQNDNLGNDVGAKKGDARMLRVPFRRLQYLENATDEYTYFGVDWSEFMFVALRGWLFHEGPVQRIPNYSTKIGQVIDVAGNWVYKNLRRGARIKKA